MNELLMQLIEEAKAKYGEYKDELIGYEKGELIGYEIYWSDCVLPLDRLQESNEYGMPSNYDLICRSASNEEYYWYKNNIFVIAKRVKVLNIGWKRELLHIINKL